MRETSVSRPLGVSLALGCCSMGGLLCCSSRQLTACGNPPYLSLPGCKQPIGAEQLEQPMPPHCAEKPPAPCEAGGGVSQQQSHAASSSLSPAICKSLAPHSRAGSIPWPPYQPHGIIYPSIYWLNHGVSAVTINLRKTLGLCSKEIWWRKVKRTHHKTRRLPIESGGLTSTAYSSTWATILALERQVTASTS